MPSSLQHCFLRLARFACLLLCVCFTGATATAAAPNGKPWNFLVMLPDDIGAKELACYGHAEHKTPRMDQLAGEGMRFETGYVTPLCSPTRVMVMTGRYGHRTGWNNLIDRPGSPTAADPDYDLAKAELSFAQLLKTKGYATALAGKWQLTGKLPTLIHDCGFDEYRMWAYSWNLPEGVKHTGGWEGRKDSGRTARYWHPCIMDNGKYVPTKPTDYGPELYSDFLIDFMKRHKNGPFLAYYPMTLTHKPWDPVPDLAHPGQKLPGGLKNNVEYLDHIVGKMVDAVDQLGIADNTLIFLIGDNGTGEDGKGTVTELGARVPFIVRCPGFVKENTVSRQLVSGADVFPTLAELSGATLPDGLEIDGLSLVKTLQDPAVHHRDWLYSYLGDKQMIRDQRWLLEGDGKLYDCGDARDGVQSYRDVTRGANPEIADTLQRFKKILAELKSDNAPPRGQRRNRQQSDE